MDLGPISFYRIVWGLSARIACAIQVKTRTHSENLLRRRFLRSLFRAFFGGPLAFFQFSLSLFFSLLLLFQLLLPFLITVISIRQGVTSPEWTQISHSDVSATAAGTFSV